MKKILIALIALNFFSPIVMADDTAGTSGGVPSENASTHQLKKAKKRKLIVKQGNKNAKTDTADRDALKNPRELSDESKAIENATH